MLDAATTKSSFRVGRVLGRTFGCIGRNAPAIFIVTVTVHVLQFASVYGLTKAVTTLLAGSTSLQVRVQFGGLLSLLVTLPLHAFLVGSFSFLAFVDGTGHRLGLLDTVRAGLRSLLPILALILIIYTALFIGLALLVVPGIVVMLFWIVAAPVRAVEGPGIGQALRNSAQLTKDNRWRIAALIALYVLVIGSIGGGELFLVLRRPDLVQPSSVWWVVAQQVTGAISGAVSAIAVGVIYAELRRSRESGMSIQLADVFT